jgi:YbgC/YbaW family acyl-CoA thioester hydrolase
MENPLYRHPSEITFRDTDASGWMHFANIFHHVEIAEHACLRARGVLVFDRSHGGWPRVKVGCDYLRPLLCGDKIEVQLAIAAIGTASVTWNFEVINPRGELAAHGSITTVRVDHLGHPQALDAFERKQLECGI